MNLKEHCLDEIELHTSLVKEGIGCLLHTILTIRAPGKYFTDKKQKIGIVYIRFK